MFSDEFARRALTEAGLRPSSTVMDPWLGVGTTISAAGAGGHRAYGIDINPVMVTISRGRCAERSAAADMFSRVAASVSKGGYQPLAKDDPLLAWFGPRASVAIRNWANAISSLCHVAGDPALEGFLFTVLFEATWKLAAPYRSKNPTWVKQPTRSQRVDAGPDKIAQLIAAAVAEKIILCPEKEFAFRPSVCLGTSTDISLADQSVDFVLTSPPYCTRIDYAMATRIEGSILGHDAKTLSQLRMKTMGSSTIRGTLASPVNAWGDTCLRFLQSVADHPSKGSATYYLKTYLQYFDDLCASLTEIGRCVRLGGSAVVVVQDSFYKGIHADLPTIYAEIGTNLGLTLIARQDHLISRSMRAINTRSRGYGEGNPTETVLWFVKGKPLNKGQCHGKTR